MREEDGDRGSMWILLVSVSGVPMEERIVKAPLNIFGIGTEVGRVVYLVLEKLQSSISQRHVQRINTCSGTYNTSDLIADEIGRLVDVVSLHQEVICERPGLDS